MGSVRAELMLLRKRSATWILLAFAIVLSELFAYVLPYASYLSAPADERSAADLVALLPARVVSSVLGQFPFFVGMLALILGALLCGSEYDWGTLKTTLTQQPSRMRLFLAKLSALGVTLALLTVVIFVAGAVSSFAVAAREDAAVTWPAFSDIVGGFGAGWLILALWTLFGVLLAILSRGTALAIGLGIVYGLIIEGTISGFGTSVALLEDIAQAFLRTNGYSLIAPLGVGASAQTRGPGTFSGPYVDAWQALLVIVVYLCVFSGISALLLQRRDVT